MNRRRFLYGGVAGSTVIAAGGTVGFLFVRRNQARAEVTSLMLDDALPPLTANSLRELNTLPVRAREEIKRYFDGNCLNAPSFVNHVYSDEFREHLSRCRTRDDRHACYMQAFCSRVATPEEVLNQVHVIAADVGSDLDSAWALYGTDLSKRWGSRIQGSGNPLSVAELCNRLDAKIGTDITQAVHELEAAHQKPALGETIGKIGQSAILLLPLARLGPKVYVPAFLIAAAMPLWDYAMSRCDDSSSDAKAALRGRLALLGNHVGAAFESEVRQRLADLHTWQERSVRETATRLAEERIGLIGGIS